MCMDCLTPDAAAENASGFLTRFRHFSVSVKLFLAAISFPFSTRPPRNLLFFFFLFPQSAEYEISRKIETVARGEENYSKGIEEHYRICFVQSVCDKCKIISPKSTKKEFEIMCKTLFISNYGTHFLKCHLATLESTTSLSFSRIDRSRQHSSLLHALLLPPSS
jgi:hypothetical protein